MTLRKRHVCMHAMHCTALQNAWARVRTRAGALPAAEGAACARGDGGVAGRRAARQRRRARGGAAGQAARANAVELCSLAQKSTHSRRSARRSGCSLREGRARASALRARGGACAAGGGAARAGRRDAPAQARRGMRQSARPSGVGASEGARARSSKRRVASAARLWRRDRRRPAVRTRGGDAHLGGRGGAGRARRSRLRGGGERGARDEGLRPVNTRPHAAAGRPHGACGATRSASWRGWAAPARSAAARRRGCCLAATHAHKLHCLWGSAHTFRTGVAAPGARAAGVAPSAAGRRTGVAAAPGARAAGAPGAPGARAAAAGDAAASPGLRVPAGVTGAPGGRAGGASPGLRAAAGGARPDMAAQGGSSPGSQFCTRFFCAACVTWQTMPRHVLPAAFVLRRANSEGLSPFRLAARLYPDVDGSTGPTEALHDAVVLLNTHAESAASRPVGSNVPHQRAHALRST
jgi:hypothetical protein